MSPEQVGSALGLETVTERIISYEGMVRYAGSSDPRHVRVCVMRDGYAFTLKYVEVATNGLAMSERLWRPDLDWPKGTSTPNQSLASIGNPFEGTQSIRLSGFAVDVKTNSLMPVAANIWIKAGRLEDVKKRQADVEKCIRSRLAGLTTKDLAKARARTAIQLDVRSALNSAIPGHPIRYVDLVFDVQ